MNNIFIHITAINNYINILNDFKNKIETSGLIHDIDRVYLCVSGKNELISDGKYEVLNNGNNLLEFEFPTLDRIKYHCKNNDGNILYLHMKGISDPNNKCLIDWRNYMMYFLETFI